MPVAEGKMLLDTNVLIYATLQNDPRSAAAREILIAPSDAVERCISVQNLAEMYPNLTGPRTQPPDSPQIAAAKIASVALLRTIHVLPLTSDIVRLALELCEKYGVTRQRYFDFQLVATMVAYAVPTLVTENSADFTGVTEIRVVNPFSGTTALVQPPGGAC